jgi:hypothetical protein
VNKDLHEQYQDVRFDKKQIPMFADIISADKVTKKVLTNIGSILLDQRKRNSQIGLTVNDIVENVTVNRKEKVIEGKSFKYRQTVTNIEKKTAERIVNKLLDMSLLYYDSIKPYKFLHMTERGWQITEEIIDRKKRGVDTKNG